MNDLIDVISFNDIFHIENIKILLDQIVNKDELVYYLKNVDYSSFNDIKSKQDINNIKLSHVFNFLIDNRKNVHKVVDLNKMKKKKIKLRDLVNFESYTKWIHFYKLVGLLAKLNS
jgi:hypothetical protein